MKRNLQSTLWFITLLLTSLMLVVSCDDSDPAPDTAAPMLKSISQDSSSTTDLDFYVELLSNTPDSINLQEGESFKLRIVNPTSIDQDINVNISFAGGAEYGADFILDGPDVQSASSEGALVTISKDLGEAEVIVEVLTDQLDEPDEFVTVSLESATLEDGTEFIVDENSISGISSTVKIENVNFYVELESNTPDGSTIKEGEKFSFKIVNPVSIGHDINVNVSFSGAAEYGEDFTLEGTDLQSVNSEGALITVFSGSMESEITVNILRDGVEELNELFTVSLDGATSEDGREYTAGDFGSSALSTSIEIENVSTIASISKSEFDVTVDDERIINIPVVLDLPAIAETTLSYGITIESGQVGDFYSDVTNGSVTFQEGETEKNIEVFVRDAAFEDCDDVILKVSIENSVITSDDNDIEISNTDDESLITAKPTRRCYCDSNGNTGLEHIERIIIGSIDNLSGDNGGYGDFTSLSTNVQAGTSITVNFQTGFPSSSYTEYYRIWIDLNQDGVFSSTELLLQESTSSSALQSHTLNIPSTALLGSTRMRVSMKFASYAGPCGYIGDGEVEDYTVNITNNSSRVTQTPNFNAEPVSQNNDILFLRADGASNQDKFDVEIKNIDQSQKIEIYNSNNDLAKSIVADGERTTIDTSDLNNGTYTLKAQAAGKTVSAKFVVQ